MDEWLDVHEAVERAHDLVDMGLFDDARELLEPYEEIYRDVWEIPFVCSRICSETGQYREAIGHLQRCMKLGGRTVDTYLGLFYAHTQLGQIRHGARYLLRARRRYPNNENVLASLIWYYGETNRFRQGLAAYKRAMALAAENPEIYRNAGLIYQRLGDYTNAARCFERALDLAPLSEEIHDLLADLHILVGETEKATVLYRSLLERSPNSVHALSRLVFCLAQGGKLDAAEMEARRTIALYPNSPVGYVDLAYVYLNGNRLDDALEQIEAALSVAPLEAEAYRVKGIVLSEQERDTDAEEAFRTALSLDTDNPEIMRDYYHHLRRIGDFRRMEQVVGSVIRRERPYCVEDYWFLADHYWEEGKSLKAFQCLNRAHKSMPGERELLPPLITIMLDRGHVSYAMPYLLSYVDKAGWDEAMKAFSRHRSLRGPLARESLRFLRYYADRPGSYRTRAYARFVSTLLSSLPLVLVVPAGLVAFASGGTTVAGFTIAACGTLFLVVRTVQYAVEGPPLVFRKLFFGAR